MASHTKKGGNTSTCGYKCLPSHHNSMVKKPINKTKKKWGRHIYVINELPLVVELEFCHLLFLRPPVIAHDPVFQQQMHQQIVPVVFSVLQ